MNNNKSVVASVEQSGNTPIAYKAKGQSGKQNNKNEKKLTRETKRMLFYIAVMVLPVIQFCLCYIYVNVNSIFMAFKEFEPSSRTIIFAGFKNFDEALKIFSTSWDMIKSSLILFAINMGIVLCLAIVFSYYISKHYFCSKLFRITMYMPQMISGIVFVLIYKYLTIDVSEKLFQVRLLEEHQYACILFFNVWMGFGTNVMLFTGAMSAIPESMVEACHMDGANIVEEFFHITIPSIWKTFVTFVVVGITGIFTNQMALYTFFESKGSEFSTFGYYFFLNSQKLSSLGWEYIPVRENDVTLPILSATGLLITLVLVPFTFGVKALLEKFGPSVD